MESKVLENLKKDLMKDKIVTTLKTKLDASFNEYMLGEYAEKLDSWKHAVRNNYSHGMDKPEPRPSTDVYLKKVEPHIAKLKLSDGADFVVMVNGSRKSVGISIYALSTDGFLTRFYSWNGEKPEKVEYPVSRDISRIEFRGESNSIALYIYHRKWEAAEVIEFETEEATDDFYTKLNDFRNRRQGFNKTRG